VYIYYIDVSNISSSRFNSILKIYRFKLFKKTTKFKRYNRGLTRFITNRKKYILRKKRTSLQFMVNLTYFWTQSYQDLRNSVRFLQSLNSLEYSLTLSNKLFTKKIALKLTDAQNAQIADIPFSMSTIKKTILLNNSLYLPNVSSGFISLFYNTQVGLVNFPTNDTKLRDTLTFGVLTDFKNSYINDVNSSSPSKLKSVLPPLLKKIFLTSFNTIKAVKKIMVLLVLMSI